MKSKPLLMLMLGFALLPLWTHAASSDMLEDTSLMRISSPERRTDFLTQKMAEHLGLELDDVGKVRDINGKYELQLQQFAQQYPKPDKKAMVEFREISENRDAELKKVLSKNQYKDFNSQRLSLRTALMEQMNKEHGERQRMYAEQLRHEEQQRVADSLALFAPVKPQKSVKTPTIKKKTTAKKPTTKKPTKKKQQQSQQQKRRKKQVNEVNTLHQNSRIIGRKNGALCGLQHAH
jgi:hypothetical protein